MLTVAYILIAIGFLLLVAELFIPSGGVLFALAVAALAIGVAMTFFHDTSTGVTTLIGVFVALPLVVGLMLYIWPKTAVGKKLFLPAPGEEATVAAMQVNKELEQLRGRYGKTLSALRPSGVVDFDGRRIDTITEGMMVEAGQWVRCVGVEASKVIVRPAEKPNVSGPLPAER